MKHFNSKIQWSGLLIGIALFFTAGLHQSFAQNAVKGNVKGSDIETGLPGVNIILKGTNNGTVTDIDGNFQISIPDSNAVLIISSIGYLSQEINVTNQANVEIMLELDVTSLEEIIVIGYGEQSKKEVTTAVSKVSAKTIEALPVYRSEQALQGTAPGVIVLQESGSPGAPLTVRVRGLASANSSNPLYLVDGVMVPSLDFLNSADIDNISVLKDAASAAIYGARGGNGVVLVTTKSGKRNSGNPKVSINGYYGVQSMPNKPELMDKNQWVDYYNKSVDYYNDRGLSGVPTRGKFTDAEKIALPNTDWYDVMFDDAPMSNLFATVSDGGDKYSWVLSAGTFSQDGILGASQNKSGFERNSLRGRFETDLAKGLNISVGGTYAKTDRNFLYENSAGTGTSVMNYINNLAPIYPTYDGPSGEIFNPGRQTPPPFYTAPDGSQIQLPVIGAITNPLIAMELTNNNAVNNVATADVALKWEIGDFELSSTYSYFGSNALNRTFTPRYNYPTQSLFNSPNRYSETNTDFWRTQWDNFIKYNFETNSGHKIKALLGVSVIQDQLDINSKSGNDFYTNSFDEINFGLIKDINAISVTQPYIEENGWLSYFGRVDYSYKDKYMVGATLRSDASSKFGANNRSGLFPSLSAGWNVSEENFLAGSGAIDLFKIRGSWGVNGNDQIPAYQYLTTLKTDGNYLFGDGGHTLSDGIYPSILGNPDIKWEEVSQINIGADLNLFDNRLGFSVDYFVKTTTDMLIPGVGTPILVGQNAPFRNAADVENKGWEFLTTYKSTVNEDFSWNVSLNLATLKNKVTSLGGGEPISGGFDRPAWEAPISRTEVGYPIGSFYGFQMEGLDDNGEMVFKDLDGEEGITVDDKTIIGNPFPDFTYGITGGLNYKGFDFSFFFYGNEGNEIYKAFSRPDASNMNKQSALSSWTSGSTDIPRSNLFGNAPNNAQVSDYYIEDGSFVKLKTLTLGYTLPASVSDKIKSNRIRFYVTGQNLLTFTNYTGADPEIGQSSSFNFLDIGIDRGFYPQPRTILGGFQINFF